MTSAILDWSLLGAQAMLVLAMACTAVRMVRGPRAQDRILGLDTFYVNAMLLLVVLGISTNSTVLFEVALIIGLLGFAATVAFAKFLSRGEVIE